MPGIRVGSIVMYVLDSMFGHQAGEVRPAIVVKKWNDLSVQLQVFVDGSNDLQADKTIVEVNKPTQSDQYQSLADCAVKAMCPPCVWRTSVFEDDEKIEGTWHRA